MRRFTQASVANPLAGHDFTFTPSESDAWTLRTLRAKFVTSAVVANRFPHVQILDQSGVVVHEVTAVTAQAAGATVTYQFAGGNGAPYQGGAVTDGLAGLALPDICFPAGYQVKTVTTALDVGDAWSGIVWTALIGHEWEHLKYLEQIAAEIGH